MKEIVAKLTYPHDNASGNEIRLERIGTVCAEIKSIAKHDSLIPAKLHY